MTSGYDKICAEIDEEFTRFCFLYDRYLDRYAEMGNLIRDVIKLNSNSNFNSNSFNNSSIIHFSYRAISIFPRQSILWGPPLCLPSHST